MVEKTNYEVLDEILKDSQRDRTNKVWVNSEYHPDRGYWCDEVEAGNTWQKLKDREELERYFRGGG